MALASYLPSDILAIFPQQWTLQPRVKHNTELLGWLSLWHGYFLSVLFCFRRKCVIWVCCLTMTVDCILSQSHLMSSCFSETVADFTSICSTCLLSPCKVVTNICRGTFQTMQMSCSPEFPLELVPWMFLACTDLLLWQLPNDFLISACPFFTSWT